MRYTALWLISDLLILSAGAIAGCATDRWWHERELSLYLHTDLTSNNATFWRNEAFDAYSGKSPTP